MNKWMDGRRGGGRNEGGTGDWAPVSCASPVDVVAHARDESGQEHERLPVWRLFTRDAAHVTVGPAVTLRQTTTKKHTF